MGHSVIFPLPVSLVADTEELDFDVIYSSEGGGGVVCGMLHIFMQTFYLFSLLGLKCCDMAVHIAKSQTILFNYSSKFREKCIWYMSTSAPDF
jgi:hypothetical protein